VQRVCGVNWSSGVCVQLVVWGGLGRCAGGHAVVCWE
jgi:hypothetical protein